MSLIVIVASSFAYFTDKTSDGGSLQFGKISIVEGKGFATGSAKLNDKLPGDTITDEISFSKAVDSANMLVRAKVIFTTESEEQTVKDFVTALNGGAFNIKAYTDKAYNWSEKQTGNYFYLMDNTNTDNVYTLASTEEIVLADSLVLSTELEQGTDINGNITYSQYMEQVSINIEIQAIQADNLTSKTLTDVSVLFAELFD